MEFFLILAITTCIMLSIMLFLAYTVIIDGSDLSSLELGVDFNNPDNRIDGCRGYIWGFMTSRKKDVVVATYINGIVWKKDVCINDLCLDMNPLREKNDYLPWQLHNNEIVVKNNSRVLVVGTMQKNKLIAEFAIDESPEKVKEMIDEHNNIDINTIFNICVWGLVVLLPYVAWKLTL